MKTATMGFIGGGRVTRIILQAFRNRTLAFSVVKVFEPSGETASNLKKQFPFIELTSTPEEAGQQEIVFLAVHPPVMMETLEKIKEHVSGVTTIISLAPKITIAKINAILPTEKIVRMIPNATSFINEGYNPVTFHRSLTSEEKKSLTSLLSLPGETMEVEEPMLEGYAIVSAMLPTYFWFQWKKMEEIAVKMGFSKSEAKKIVGDTLKKSIALYYESGLSPEEVIDLIPVKPIGEHEGEIEQMLETKLLGLYEKIKP